MFQALELGPFIIWSRLLFALIGLWLAAEFLLRIAESANLSLQHFRQHSAWYVLAFVLCGRAISVISEYQVYLRDPFRMLVLWDGNFSFLGATIGIGVVLYIVTRGHRSIFLQWLDALVPAATLGLVFDWVGAFFAGDAYGRPTDMFWGVTYDAINVRYTIPLHPVQLYYAIFFFILTFLLLIVRKRGKRVGAETLLGIVCAAVGTFLLENFRGDFAIPVFATQVDFILLTGLFVSLGALTLLSQRISKRFAFFYEIALILMACGYFFARPWLELEMYEFRLSQLLAVLALLAAVVYVVVVRRKHPYF